MGILDGKPYLVVRLRGDAQLYFRDLIVVGFALLGLSLLAGYFALTDGAIALWAPMLFLGLSVLCLATGWVWRVPWTIEIDSERQVSARCRLATVRCTVADVQLSFAPPPTFFFHTQRTGGVRQELRYLKLTLPEGIELYCKDAAAHATIEELKKPAPSLPAA